MIAVVAIVIALIVGWVREGIAEDKVRRGDY